MATARRLLSQQLSDYDRSVAHHTVAIVERDRGRVDEARAAARAALVAARRVGPDREAEVLATLGTTHLFAGETTRGLAALNRASEMATGDGLARVLHLRACTYWLLGRHDEALTDATAALDLVRRSGNDLWVGRTLGVRGDILRALGDTAGSARDYACAETVLLEMGQVTEATLCAHNRALGAVDDGDVVGALTLMEQAEERLRESGVDVPIDQLIDHADALVTARLGAEASALIDEILGRPDLAPVWRGDLLLASARAALLQHDWDTARERAGRAQQLFSAHRRARWAARATLLSIEAVQAGREEAGAGGAPTPSASNAAMAGLPSAAAELDHLAAATRRLVAQLRRLSDPSLPEALLLLGQVTSGTRHELVGRRALAEAATRRRSGAPLSRAAGWLAAALLADRAGDRRAMRHACRRGLDAVDEHRSVIGDLELRALATGYGSELASLALEDAARIGDARGVLWWTERWRATALEAAVVRPQEDADLARGVAALRAVTRRCEGAHDPVLDRARARLERDVRTRYRRLRTSSTDQPGPDIGQIAAHLGDTVLLCIARDRDRLRAVTVADGRVTLRHLGSIEGMRREVGFAQFALRRAAHGRPVDLAAAGDSLQGALLGDSAPDPAWSRPSVLVVPVATLLTSPFGLLPMFRDTAVVVSPSVSQWRRAGTATADAGAGAARAAGPAGHVALITGPGLSSKEREVTELRHLHADALVLDGPDATIERSLAILDGARLAHLAAHGSFRADAPLFSSLRLDDGPLMVHDLDRLARPPGTVVLSACDSGGAHPIGADEALGLVTSLLALGTRSVVASVAPVNDVATAEIMPLVHATLLRGGTPAEGLLAARRAAAGDPLMAAAAAAFNAWGA